MSGSSVEFRLPRGRHSPLGRLVGSAASWFLFALCVTLLSLSTNQVLGAGGYCASGGPYEVAAACSATVEALAPLGIFGCLFAVGIAAILSAGFGMSLLALAWPILFCGLGGVFFATYAEGREWGPLVLGILFCLMGGAPLVIALRNRPQALLLGSVSLRGEFFTSRDRGGFAMLAGWAPDAVGTVRPSRASWVLSLIGGLAPAAAGLLVALVWFASI